MEFQWKIIIFHLNTGIPLECLVIRIPVKHLYSMSSIQPSFKTKLSFSLETAIQPEYMKNHAEYFQWNSSGFSMEFQWNVNGIPVVSMKFRHFFTTEMQARFQWNSTSFFSIGNSQRLNPINININYLELVLAERRASPCQGEREVILNTCRAAWRGQIQA